MTDPAGFRIIKLEVEGVKRVRAITIEPRTPVVELTGKNKQGKTSLLDSIYWVFSGAGEVQAEPINSESDSARIVVDLGGDDGKLALKVTRRFGRVKEGAKSTAPFTSTLVVENDEGARYSKPQETLEKLVGALSFDPLAFTRMKPAQQFETLRSFVKGVDFDALDKADAADYDARTMHNTLARKAAAAAEAIAIDEGLIGSSEANEADLVAKLESAGQHNATLEQRRAGRAEAQRLLGEKRNLAATQGRLIEKLEADLKVAQALLAQYTSEGDELQAKIDNAEALPAPIDTAELTHEITKARQHNQTRATALALQAKRAELVEEANAAQKQAEALTARMAARAKERHAAIAKAELPIAGLGFGDKCVTMNGHPFEQASDAEQLAVSVAIAAAMNPRLRVIRIRDGSLLDSDAWVSLEKFAAERGYQIWVETVQSSRDGALVIEDGRLASPPDGADADAVAAQ